MEHRADILLVHFFFKKKIVGESKEENRTTTIYVDGHYTDGITNLLTKSNKGLLEPTTHSWGFLYINIVPVTLRNKSTSLNSLMIPINFWVLKIHKKKKRKKRVQAALWHSRLGSHLQFWHPLWVPIRVLTAPHPI